MKKIIYLLLFLVFCTSSSPLFAQGDSELLLLEQSTPSASPAIEIQAPVKTIMARINAAANRIEKIYERISSRFQSLSNSKVKNITKLNLRYNTLTKDVAKLKLDLSRLEEAASSFLSSADYKKNYQAYRKELVIVRDELKNILSLEESFIASMKQYVLPTVTPTATPVKVKGGSPTTTI